ncbi:MAG: hypothetical protein ACTHNN_17480 [Xanthobacteraceae bacterium]
MPVRTVVNDLAEGRLIELSIEELLRGGTLLPMFANYREASCWDLPNAGSTSENRNPNLESRRFRGAGQLYL